ncbi:YTH domain-containing protein 1-like isoform X2 [Stylophora pistillata]|uniref:YTH domain-containing protein 1-like isoform X2 n=1 Tax=Stylophora pistillata TaxID=50429 RepID=UPI000C038C88|nr:YTH domain-containing protein 1-like isoform X2 [Stylophora pistillata]
MKWFLLLTFALLTVGVLSAPANDEEDELLTEVAEKDEALDEPETEKEEERFVREVGDEEENEELEEAVMQDTVENDEANVPGEAKTSVETEQSFEDSEVNDTIE